MRKATINAIRTLVRMDSTTTAQERRTILLAVSNAITAPCNTARKSREQQALEAGCNRTTLWRREKRAAVKAAQEQAKLETNNAPLCSGSTPAFEAVRTGSIPVGATINNEPATEGGAA